MNLNPGPHAKALGILFAAFPAWGAYYALQGFSSTAWWALVGIVALAAQTWIIPNQPAADPAPWNPPPLPDPAPPVVGE